jgi:hypothetical protein
MLFTLHAGLRVRPVHPAFPAPSLFLGRTIDAKLGRIVSREGGIARFQRQMNFSRIVMPALVAGIHVLKAWKKQNVDGRVKPGHDERVVLSDRALTPDSIP